MELEFKDCEDKCPKCGNKNINWDKENYAVIDVNTLVQDAYCNNCECRFIVRYKISYDSSVIL